MEEYGPLEIAQLVARIEAELVGEQRARASRGGKRFRLSPRAVEGEHELARQTLAQRVLRRQPLELRYDLGMAAEGEVRLQALFETAEPKLVQAPRFQREGAAVGHVAERGPAPERERRAQASRGEPGRPALERVASFAEEALEPPDVELIRLDLQSVPGRPSRERLGAECRTKAGDVDPQRRLGTRRRGAVPEPVDEPVARYRAPRLDEEQGQQCPLPSTADLHCLPVAHRFDRAQHPEVGRRAGTVRHPEQSILAFDPTRKRRSARVGLRSPSTATPG